MLRREKIINLFFRYASLLVFIITFIGYVVVMPLSVWVGADSGEFVTAAATLGIPHAPGYPLYTLLGHLFSLLPFYSVAWRLNLMSAVFMAGGIALLYQLIIFIFHSDNSRSSSYERYEKMFVFLLSLFTGFSYLFWLYGSVAEVFSLHIFLTMAVLYSFTVWFAYQYNNSTVLNNNRYLYLTFFLFGLALANHHTILLVLPGIIYGLILCRSYIIKKPKIIFILLVAILLGLTPYGAIPLIARMKPILNWGDPLTLSGLLQLVSRTDYGIIYGSVNSPEMLSITSLIARIKTYGWHIITSFSVLNLGIIGLPFLSEKFRRISLILGISFIFSGPLFLGYLNVPTSDPLGTAVVERFYLLPDLLFTLLVSLGAYQLLQKARENLSQILSNLILIIFGFGFITMLLSQYSRVNKHDQTLSQDYFINCIKTLPENSIFIVGGDGPSFISYYYRYAENLSSEQIIVTQGLLGASWYQRTIGSIYDNRIAVRNMSANPGEGLRIFVSDNISRYRIFSNTNTEKSVVTNGLDYLPVGMLYEIVDRDNRVDGKTYVELNKKLWNSYRTGSMKNIDQYYSPFEKQIMIDYGVSHYNQGFLYQQFGLSDEAEAEYRQAIEINHYLYKAYNNLALVLLSREKYDEAKSVLEKGISYGKKEDYQELESLYSNLALVYEKYYSDSAKSGELWRKYNLLKQ